jgi:hypothetical protein
VNCPHFEELVSRRGTREREKCGRLCGGRAYPSASPLSASLSGPCSSNLSNTTAWPFCWHGLIRGAGWLQLPTDPRTRVLGLTESNYNVLASLTTTQQADPEYV